MNLIHLGALIALTPLLATPRVLAAAAPSDKTTFSHSIRAVDAQATGPGRAFVTRLALSGDEGAAALTVELALRMRNFDELQARIARGEQIPRAEMEARYFPLKADHDAVVAWARASGLTVSRTDDNRLAVFVRAPVSALSQAFGVTFARVQGWDGGEYTSAITAPALPVDVARPVLGIHGLQPHNKLRPLSIHPGQGATTDAGGGSSGYSPSQIAAAYGASSLSQNGSGQTIAIYALGFPLISDLTSFWSYAGVSQSVSNVTNVIVGQGPASSPSSGVLEEVSLDTEWSGALAPAAKIRIYGANENDTGENDEILQQVYADLSSYPSMHQLCICIGGYEKETDRDYLVIEAQYMANLAASGVSVLVASGDSGAYGPTADEVEVTTPTSDPDVTGVGGTTLLLSGNTVTGETAWSYASSSTGGSGGGESYFYAKPSWQTGTGVPTTATMRLVPDVAAAADPNYGGTYFYNGGKGAIGGTSWAAPIWTAFTALLNQNLSTPLGLLNPRLYPLNPQGNSPGYFTDIVSGSNGAYNAGPGYDEVTGLGTPLLNKLAATTLSPAEGIAVASQLGAVYATTGQAATFNVVIAGPAPVTYKWQRMASGSSSWAALSDNATYSGSSTSTLVVNAATLAMSGDQFECVATDSGGSVTSAPEVLTVNAYGTTTLAGWPEASGSADGTGWAARFSYPGSIRVDSAGTIYVADASNNTIRRITPAGVVTTIAGKAGVSGSADGPAASARFNGPAGVAPDGAGNLYVADNTNCTIRLISASGVVSTIAGSAGVQGVVDGTGSAARFYDPQNLAYDPTSGDVFVVDGKANVVRRVTPAGVVTTLAGTPVNNGPAVAGSTDGPGSSAQFNFPTGVTVDAFGNVYVSDTGNDTIRKITQAGVVSTLAGAVGQAGYADGSGSSARFDAPAGLAADAVGNLVVSDSNNSLIRWVSNAAGNASTNTLAGILSDPENIDGPFGTSKVSAPGDVAYGPDGAIYVADSLNNTVRRIVGTNSAQAPSVTTQPASQTVNTGGSFILACGLGGTPPFTYQWYLNGSTIAGATAPSLTIGNAQQANAGVYHLIANNAEGGVQSADATISVVTPSGYPTLETQPQGGILSSGGSLTVYVTVGGSGAFTYQWYLNGSPIAGATGASYAATAVGSYTVTVSNGVGSVTSAAAVVTAGSRLINISTRAGVSTGSAITIAGIHISGPSSESKTLLVRGIGPALSAFGLSGALASPTVAVYDKGGSVIVSNTGWGNAPVAGNSTVSATYRAATATDMSQVGAFSLTAGSADSALVISVPPDSYTVELSGLDATVGLGLVEVYEMNTSDPAILTDISTRANVGTGSSVPIAGFVVNGTVPATVLVRGIGPTLGNTFGVSGALAQPIVGVYDSNSVLIASNTGWGNAPVAGGSTVKATFRQATAADMSSAGAFSLTAGSADSALVLTLPPGNSYSVEISGVGGAIGVALAEVYQIEP